MARVAQTVVTASQADGHEISFSAFGDGSGEMEYLNTNQDVTIIIYNGSGAPRTVTVVQKNTTAGLQEATISDKTYTVADSAYFIIPPLEGQYYNDSTDNLVDVDIDDDTSVTVAVVKIPRV